MSHSCPVTVLTELRDHVVLGLVDDPVRTEVIVVEAAVQTDGGYVAAAHEGADAGTLLGHREAGQTPLTAGVGPGDPNTGQGRPLVQPVVLQGEDVDRPLVAAAAQPLLTAAEVDAVDAGLGMRQVLK